MKTSSTLILFITCMLFVANSYSQRMPTQTFELDVDATASFSSNSGNYVVAYGNRAILYSTFAYDKVTELGVNKKTVNDAAFSPSGNAVAIVGKEPTVDIWDIASKTLTARITANDQALAVRYLNDEYIVTISELRTNVYNIAESSNKGMVYPKRQYADHSGRIRALAVSPSGKYFATGGEDGRVNIYDGTTLENISKKIVHKGFVRTLAISPNDEWIAGGDESGQLIVQHIPTGETKTIANVRGWLRTVTFSDDGKYIAAGSDGGEIILLDATTHKQVEKFKGFREPVISLDFSPDGTRLAALEFFRGVRVYNTTDLQIAPANKLKNDEDRTPPQIFISAPTRIVEDKVTVYRDIVELKGSLIDDAGVNSLKINGVTVPLKNNNNFTMFVPLAMGENRITIEARDINDNISRREFTATRKNMDGEEVDVANAKNYLIVIGIDDYEHWPKLNNAVRDANDITGVLLDKYRFSFENIVMLKNEQATRANIYRGLRSLIEKVGPNDNLMIYYSGHGYFDQLLNEGYWIPADANTNSTGEYLSNSDILKIVSNINSRHTFLIADACFSGSLFADSKRGYADNVEKFRSRWGLVSGRLEVVSDGAVGTNSPFAASVLKFLRDNNKDKVTASELVQHVKLRVAEISNQTPLGNPLKVVGDEGGEFVFYKK